MTADLVPDYESTVAERLNRAGAILLGKLNLSEYAMGRQVLSGFGPARNSWHLGHSPAGSSWASGVALAAYLSALTIGTDTGGSIRGPASANGIVGMKQTYGRVSRYGVSTLAWTLDHAGPMMRTVADNALMPQAIPGFGPMDPASADEPVPDYLQSLGRDVRGVRIGLPTTYFFDDLSADVERGVRDAIETLRRLGAVTVEVDIPHAHYAGSAGRMIAMAEGACYHETRLREQPQLFGPLVRERLETAKFHTASDYIKAMRVRSILVEEMKEVIRRCDVMAVPGSGSVAGLIPPPEVARTDVTTSDPPPYRGGIHFHREHDGTSRHDNALRLLVKHTTTARVDPALRLTFRRIRDLPGVAHTYATETRWHLERATMAET